MLRITITLGAVILICGLIGWKNQKVGIHLTLVVAILGILGTLGNVLKLGDIFVDVCSFITVRRWKQNAPRGVDRTGGGSTARHRRLPARQRYEDRRDRGRHPRAWHAGVRCGGSRGRR